MESSEIIWDQFVEKRVEPLIVSVCMWCKEALRENELNLANEAEAIKKIAEGVNLGISHGLCQPCKNEHYPE